jgi:hypothetical protein
MLLNPVFDFDLLHLVGRPWQTHSRKNASLLLKQSGFHRRFAAWITMIRSVISSKGSRRPRSPVLCKASTSRPQNLRMKISFGSWKSINSHRSVHTRHCLARIQNQKPFHFDRSRESEQEIHARTSLNGSGQIPGHGNRWEGEHCEIWNGVKRRRPSGIQRRPASRTKSRPAPSRIPVEGASKRACFTETTGLTFPLRRRCLAVSQKSG